jgi:hypothetical protein
VEATGGAVAGAALPVDAGAEPAASALDVPFEWWYRAEHRRMVAVVAALVGDWEVAADLPETEVAALMGVAPGTAAATRHAARQRLAHMWGEER